MFSAATVLAIVWFFITTVLLFWFLIDDSGTNRPIDYISAFSHTVFIMLVSTGMIPAAGLVREGAPALVGIYMLAQFAVLNHRK